MFGEHRKPVVTRVQAGYYIALDRCEVCGALWCESPYEPYSSFSFLAWWPYDEARWRKLNGADNGHLLRGWHAFQVREHYCNLPTEELAQVEWFRQRTLGHNPIDWPENFHAADI
jgi:hypothetical protein